MRPDDAPIKGAIDLASQTTRLRACSGPNPAAAEFSPNSFASFGHCSYNAEVEGSRFPVQPQSLVSGSEELNRKSLSWHLACRLIERIFGIRGRWPSGLGCRDARSSVESSRWTPSSHDRGDETGSISSRLSRASYFVDGFEDPAPRSMSVPVMGTCGKGIRRAGIF